MQSSIDNVVAVVLAGGRDFGRCPLATQLPAPLWPVEGRPALTRLLCGLAEAGIRRTVVCGGANTERYLNAIGHVPNIRISFLKEKLPVGTAGCIRDAAAAAPSELTLVVHGAIVSPPPVGWLVEAHREQKSDMTVFLDPPRDMPSLAGMYLCGAEAIACIPREGYCDIKEGLIPLLWRDSKTVGTATLSWPLGAFHDAQGYLAAVFDYLQSGTSAAATREHVIHARAQISPNARICGAVAVMENAVVCDDAVVIGPAIIEKDVVVESGATVCRSVLWRGARIGRGASVHQCIAAYDADAAANSVLEDSVLIEERNGLATAFETGAASAYTGAQKAHYRFRDAAESIVRRVPMSAHIAQGLQRAGDYIRIGVLAAVFFWLYRPEFAQLLDIWLRNDEYNSGLIVPLLAAYLVWSRRREFKRLPKRPLAAGLAVFFAAQLLRLFGLVFMYDSAQRLSLVISAAAIMLYLFGWQVFRRMAPILLFVVLMLPIPNSVHNKIMAPLQSWATSSAVFSLEMMGFEVTREGNIIHLGDATVAVAEACNGLRMITAFFVISGLVALLVERLWWEKIILFLSALPIGFLCNTLRLTLTSLAFTIVKGPLWERAFHDFGGLAMMPLAIGAVMAELWILKRLTVAHEHSAAKPQPKN